MTIPNIRITPQGYDAPTREEYEAGLWQMMRDAFGQNLNEDARTPQGQLVTSFTAMLTDKDSALIELANNFDPRFASGKFQEALGAVYFLTRSQATHSVVRITFTGDTGAVVPLGTQLQDDNGNIWETTESGIIGAGGTVTLWARSEETGQINAAIGAIEQLLDAPEGIDRAENLTPAVAGQNTESRSDFEIRRANSVAANSRLTAGAVYGAVFDLPDVLDVRVIENPRDTGINVGVTNYPMVRNSLLVSVIGGNDYDIAGKIMLKGGTGASFMGNTDVLWKDTDNYDDDFPPEYDVTFLRPDIIPLYFSVRVGDYNSLTPEDVSGIQAGILEQLQAGKNRARIGGRIIPMNFNSGLDRDLDIIEIRVSNDNSTWVSFIELGIDQFPASADDMIEVRQYVASS